MIEFRGEITGKCKKFIMKREAVISFIAMMFGAIVVSIPIIILSLTYNPFIWIMMVVPGLTFVLCLIPFFLTDYGLSKSKLIFPFRITIAKDGEMISENENFHDYRHISQIKKVVAMEEWYALYFYFPHKTLRYVCQKDLIKEGSIEEFEEMFKDKIIRKEK